jgi:hypothetical protein
MVPLLIILIGLVFLLKGLGWLSASMTDILWPIGLIMLGGQKMFEGLCKCDVKDQRP